MNNTNNQKLTIEQRTIMLLEPCKTRDELNRWIRYHLGLDLPDTIVSRYADTNPLDVVWEVYKICVLKDNPDNIEELLYVASRGSGKTLGMAIAELLVMLHDQRSIAHVGAIMGQAKRCYEYQMGFMLNSRIKDILSNKNGTPIGPIAEKTNMEKSTFNLKDQYTGQYGQSTLEVLPCTLKAVNGPHVALCVVDEIDTVSGEGLRAFKDISGMIDSKGRRQALRVGISTRKSRYGLMNKQIEDAEKADRTVRYWTALEFAQRCPDSRSGVKPVEMYVFQDEMDIITPEEFATKDKNKRLEYFKHEFPGEKCPKCKMGALCLGDAKNQTSQSSMLKPITDPIKKINENGPDWAISQLFNLKPSVEGIIYKEFDERKHVKTWNEMWLILTSKEYPGECTHDAFVRKCHAMKLSAYAGIDWGWSKPSTVVFFFVDNRENIYVVRTEGRTYTHNPAWAHIIKTKWHILYRTQLYFIDMANPGDATTMRLEGLPVPSKVDKEVMSGIQVVKKWLRPVGMSNPKIFFAKETTEHIITEFGLYHYKTDAAGRVTDDPESESDHWLDALRYPVYALFGKNKLVTADVEDGSADINVQDVDGNYHRAPSAEEYALTQGITINTEEQSTAKLGKIGKLSELEDDDETDGDGGFLWSF